MANVLQLRRKLTERPQADSIPTVEIRQFGGDADINAWLELRHRSFARQRIGVREWTANDFRAEFVSRWWWQPDRFWLAEARQSNAGDLIHSGDPAPRQLVGSVTLAMRGEPESAVPAVHWLMVEPRWRRRGIARLLMSHLESAAWDAGHREVCLETHAAWEAAVKFYESMGYH